MLSCPLPGGCIGGHAPFGRWRMGGDSEEPARRVAVPGDREISALVCITVVDWGPASILGLLPLRAFSRNGGRDWDHQVASQESCSRGGHGDARDGAQLEWFGMVSWLLPSRWQGWGVLGILLGVLSTEGRFSCLLRLS